jgi:mono/diheme cytochrome c family protein
MLLLPLLPLLLLACRQDMHDQPKYKSLRASAFFADGRTSRPRVDGTVARGELENDPARRFGKLDGEYIKVSPLPITKELLLRGRERYNIYCSVCHDRVGRGNGMIVQRGYRRPPSFHDERLREAADGYFFDVITNGFRVMPSYAREVRVRDRWAITAYIRALQLSQAAQLTQLAESERAQLEDIR